MKLLAAPVVSSILLTACAMSPSYYNPNITDSTALERQRIIDEGYCTQAAAGSVPVPQVRYYQSGVQNYQITGNIQSYGSDGYSTSSNYFGNVNSYQSPGGAFTTGLANGINMGAAIRASRERDAVFQGCMLSLGWTTDKNAIAIIAPSTTRLANAEDAKYFSIYLERAKAGDSNAQDVVAAAYQAGRGTAIDIEKTIYWATKASDQGEARASFRLSEVYLGESYPAYADPSLMRFYLQRSADQGFDLGKSILGLMYMAGEKGFPKDASKAMELSLSACQNKDAQGCVNVGILFGSGMGVKENLVMAHQFFSYAKNYGFEQAEGLIKKTESMMTKGQLLEAKSK